MLLYFAPFVNINGVKKDLSIINYFMKKFTSYFKKHKLIFTVLIIFLCFVVCSSLIFSAVLCSSSKYNGITIVIDAGHGGRDGGSVGVSGTIEKEINLDYSLALKEKLEKAGYRVVLTRKNDDGLYSPLSKNKKLSDMQARFRIIKKANPNLVVSIHMNSFRDKSAHGATTYYREGDEASQTIGNLIQKSLYTYVDAPTLNSKVGDYYILNCSYFTAVLVECGFISNPQEEAQLNTKEYKNKLTDAICNGIMLYFGTPIGS